MPLHVSALRKYLPFELKTVYSTLLIYVLRSNFLTFSSSSILLRGRTPTIRMDVNRYLGGFDEDDAVLRECDGMTIEQIHDSMQPTSFQ